MDCLICRKSQAIWGNILERGILMLKENYAKTGNGYTDNLIKFTPKTTEKNRNVKSQGQSAEFTSDYPLKKPGIIKELDFTSIMRKKDRIEDSKNFSLTYIDEISAWIMSVPVPWIAKYDRYYLIDEGDIDLYRSDRKAFIGKYYKEIGQQDCYSTRFMGSAALRDYDGAQGFQNAYRSVDGVNAFKYYGYYDGVLYARITWEKGTIYVPPGQTVSTESGRIFPLRKNCEIQVDSYGLPICYKLKNI
jgi:hypothetical protein